MICVIVSDQYFISCEIHHFTSTTYNCTDEQVLKLGERIVIFVGELHNPLNVGWNLYQIKEGRYEYNTKLSLGEFPSLAKSFTQWLLPRWMRWIWAPSKNWACKSTVKTKE